MRVPTSASHRTSPARRPAGRLLLAVALLPLAGCALLDPRQINPPPPGIARIETVVVDGLPERLLIRGDDPAHNPVLLFIHGGPGFPGAPFWQVNRDLEHDFTVVHWDQRGAGFSYFRDIPTETMRVEQFVRETLLVTHALCTRFHQRKIYLMGHSWGTLPALLAVAREPGRFYAYVALSQLVDIDESERRLTALALRRAEDSGGGDPRAARLHAVGPAPYIDLKKQDKAAALIHSLFPPVRREATKLRLALLALSSRYYTVPDLLRVNAGYQFSRKLLDPQLHGYDMRRMVPTLQVPIYFFVGRVDTTFGVSIQQEYARRLRDPAGKHFVLFAESTHWPHIEQPEDFLAEMRKVRADTWRPR